MPLELFQGQWWGYVWFVMYMLCTSFIFMICYYSHCCQWSKKFHGLSLRICLKFQSSKTVWYLSFHCNLFMKSLWEAAGSSLAPLWKEIGVGRNTRMDWMVPSILMLTWISLFPRPAVFVCFNMKQSHGSRFTKKKGVEEALVKFISLTFNCGFHQLVGQDWKTDFTER